MRSALLILIVLTIASAQGPGDTRHEAETCPRIVDLGRSPRQKYWFEGQVGKKHVRMYLERGGEGVVGALYDTANWVPLILSGKWIAQQQDAVEMTAFTASDAEVGILKAQMKDGALSGVWSGTGGEEGIELRLKSVPQPKCDGSERWKSLEDPRWPVTFSYPASWHASINADSITLTCPDASLMAYDGYEISIKQGAEANNATSDFVQCGDRWSYGYGCKCEDLGHCKSAPAMERGEMTILQGDERDWRTYCRDGGYVGEGDGVRRILTFGDTWIDVEGQGPAGQLVQRLVDTAKKRR